MTIIIKKKEGGRVLASPGKHIMFTVFLTWLANLIANFGDSLNKLNPLVVIFAFVAGVGIDIDHFFHRPTLRRVLGGSREKREQREQFVFLHSIIGFALFAVVSVILRRLEVAGWWLPIVAFISHALLDSVPIKWISGWNRYSFLVWLEWPRKRYLQPIPIKPSKEYDEYKMEIEDEKSVSLVFTAVGFVLLVWLPILVDSLTKGSMLCIVTAVASFLFLLCAGVGGFLCMFVELSSTKRIYIFDILLAVGWMCFFIFAT